MMCHNSIMCAWITTILLFCGFSTSAEDPAVIKAITDGANAKFTITITDHSGVPVPGAHILGGFWCSCDDGSFIKIDEVTDLKGQCVVSGKSNGRFTWQVSKDGFYRSEGVWRLTDTTVVPKVKDGRWQPYGGSKRIVLRKIKNPTALSDSDGSMYVKIPEFGQWIGFDVEMRHWTKPWGNGKVADILLKFEGGRKQRNGEYFRSMEVSFTNNLFAGGYVLPKEQYSQFATVYRADTNAHYCSTFKFWCERQVERPMVRNDLGKNQYMVFRTRTKVDANGRLLSACYGVLYGSWRFYEKNNMAIERILFNPVPNDTNLEFDPKRNLYQGKKRRGVIP